MCQQNHPDEHLPACQDPDNQPEQTGKKEQCHKQKEKMLARP